MLSQHIPLCVGGSLGKEVGIGGHVFELPLVVVVPGGVGIRARGVGYCSMTFTRNTQETGSLLKCGHH